MLKNRLPFLLLGIITGLIPGGCGQSTPAGENTSAAFFSLEKYFAGEIRKLNADQPEIVKTVRKNGEEEQRTITEIDWAAELKTFSGADINKPAWLNSYSVDSSAGRLVYTALEDQLRVRSLEVRFSPENKVQAIIIQRKTGNYLYTSSERLEYYPDSLYSVKRHQDVRVLGAGEFQISGKF